MDHKCLGNLLKRWADPWIPFVGESKGGAVTPDFDVFIVTSNYHPSAIWETEEELGPLYRRFKITEFVTFGKPGLAMRGHLQGPCAAGIMPQVIQCIPPKLRGVAGAV